MTALHLSASEGHEGLARLLLDRRVRLEDRDAKGWTALHWASSEGHAGVVGLLLARGADANARENEYRMTPLHLAAEGGFGEVAELLVIRGAQVNPTTVDDETPLDLALQQDQRSVAAYLRKMGGRSVNPGGPEPTPRNDV